MPLFKTTRRTLIRQPVLADGGYLAQSLLKEPAILLGAMGNDYRVGAPLEVRTRIASPMDSGEIAVLGRYAVRGIAPQGGQADIGWLMVIDRDNAARIVGSEIADVVRRMGAAGAAARMPASAPIAAAALADALAALDFDDRGDFIVDTTTAWPITVRHVRRVSSADGSRVDKVELTRIPD